MATFEDAKGERYVDPASTRDSLLRTITMALDADDAVYRVGQGFKGEDVIDLLEKGEWRYYGQVY